MDKEFTLTLSEEESNKDSKSTSKVISYTDSFNMLNIESISITDPGGTLLYNFFFDD